MANELRRGSAIAERDTKSKRIQSKGEGKITRFQGLKKKGKSEAKGGYEYFFREDYTKFAPGFRLALFLDSGLSEPFLFLKIKRRGLRKQEGRMMTGNKIVQPRPNTRVLARKSTE